MKKVGGLVQANFLHEKLDQCDQLARLISHFMALPLENRIWPLVRGKRLILMTDDPHLATQARFMTKPLCHHLNEHAELNVSKIDIKLTSMPLEKKRCHLNRQEISTETANIIGSIAAGIEDKELQTALQRLAQRSAN